MAWKITHTSWDSGFTTMARPRNRELALATFERLKKEGWIGMLTLYSPSGKKVDDYFVRDERKSEGAPQNSTGRAKRRTPVWHRRGKPVASRVSIGSPLQRIRAKSQLHVASAPAISRPRGWEKQADYDGGVVWRNNADPKLTVEVHPLDDEEGTGEQWYVYPAYEGRGIPSSPSVEDDKKVAIRIAEKLIKLPTESLRAFEWKMVD